MKAQARFRIARPTRPNEQKENADDAAYGKGSNKTPGYPHHGDESGSDCELMQCPLSTLSGCGRHRPIADIGVIGISATHAYRKRRAQTGNFEPAKRGCRALAYRRGDWCRC